MGSKIWHLELTAKEQFIPCQMVAGLELHEVSDAAINARFYRDVGEHWQWTDRLVWAEEQWVSWVDRENLRTWVALFKDEEAGYVEMEIQESGSVEIVYFGLLPEMIGKGLGGGVLSLAIQKAWEFKGTQRVWLHTCSEDHPHALRNYERRGFRLFRTVVV